MRILCNLIGVMKNLSGFTVDPKSHVCGSLILVGDLSQCTHIILSAISTSIYPNMPMKNIKSHHQCFWNMVMLFMDYCLWKGASFIDMYIYIHSYIYIFIYIYMSMLCPCIWNHSFNHTTHVVKRLSFLRTSPVSLSSRQPWWQRLRPWFANVSRCFLEYSGIWLLIPILIPIYIYAFYLDRLGYVWTCGVPWANTFDRDTDLWFCQCLEA